MKRARVVAGAGEFVGGEGVSDEVEATRRRGHRPAQLGGFDPAPAVPGVARVPLGRGATQPHVEAQVVVLDLVANGP